MFSHSAPANGFLLNTSKLSSSFSPWSHTMQCPISLDCSSLLLFTRLTPCLKYHIVRQGFSDNLMQEINLYSCKSSLLYYFSLWNRILLVHEKIYQLCIWYLSTHSLKEVRPIWFTKSQAFEVITVQCSKEKSSVPLNALSGILVTVNHFLSSPSIFNLPTLASLTSDQ